MFANFFGAVVGGVGAVVDGVGKVGTKFVTTKQDSDVSENDVTIIMTEAQVSRELAVKALKEHGNAVDAI